MHPKAYENYHIYEYEIRNVFKDKHSIPNLSKRRKTTAFRHVDIRRL